MVPPSALSIHLCIGQAYAFSVFNLPMSKLIGITKSAPDDWKLTDLGWIFSIAIFFLGFSAAVLGRWVEEGGPRRAMFTAALCFGGGFLVSAFGVSVHNLWVVYLGYGVLGGIGLGLGYISPVSTFDQMVSRPARDGDRHGDHGLRRRGHDRRAAFGVAHERVLDADAHRGRRDLCRPRDRLRHLHAGRREHRPAAGAGMEAEGYVPPAQPKKLVTTKDVYVYQALKTPQFWLIWIVLHE
jgi:Major Facilitator Superfamily